MGSESEEIIQIYTIVEAKSVNDLVKLVNIKTKQSWICLGGMCYTPNNVCESDQNNYPYCQTMYRMEKPKKQVPVKTFEAFPYDGKKDSKKDDGKKDGKQKERNDHLVKKYHEKRSEIRQRPDPVPVSISHSKKKKYFKRYGKKPNDEKK